MNFSWYLRPTSHVPGAPTHDADEIIRFFGSNPDDPYNLGGEIEFWLVDEKYILTRNCLIFVSKGMKHCTLILRCVDRHIFHFTTVNSGLYKVIRNE